MDKKMARLRRAKRTRAIIQKLNVARLCVHRTSQHIYAQIIFGDQVLTSASTVEKDMRTMLSHGGNMEAAKKIGELVAQRALQKDIKKVAFDRSGFKYHGRIKALAEAARNGGLDF